MANDELRHAEGWNKKNAKYVKKIPKPGGGYYYVYPEDLKKQAQNTLNKAKYTAYKAGEKAKNIARDKIGLTAKDNVQKSSELARYWMATKQPTFKDHDTTGALVRGESRFIKKAKEEYDATPLGKAEKLAKNLGKAGKKAAEKTGELAKQAGKDITEAAKNTSDSVKDYAEKKKKEYARKQIKKKVEKTIADGKKKVDKFINDVKKKKKK